MANQKYKLNKIQKAGIAVGLSLSIATTGITGFFAKIIYDSTHPNYNQSNINTDSSYNETATSDYINALMTNELNELDYDNDTTNIKLNNYNYFNFINTLNDTSYDFSMENYYYINEALEIYKNTEVKKEKTKNLIDENGKISTTKLINQVLKNNQKCIKDGTNSLDSDYENLDYTNIAEICEVITEIVNNTLNTEEIKELDHILSKLTIFTDPSSLSNAKVTDNNTLVYNPKMVENYAKIKKITGEITEKKDVIKSVITHEIKHLIQNKANDLNKNNGLETGICRYYYDENNNPIKVNSLWNTWLLDASAEIETARYLNCQPGTYTKLISYLQSYNFSKFNDLNLTTETLEKSSFKSTLEEAYNLLKIENETEQKEFLKFLYSVEVMQNDDNSFWKNYENEKGKILTENEKAAIKYQTRANVIKYLSKNFYSNLVDAINEEKITDLDTMFYFMRLWEIDSYKHLEYTKEEFIPYAKNFIQWQDKVQNSLFTAIAESNNMNTNDIKTMYEEYNIQTEINGQKYDNCNLKKFDNTKVDYIKNLKKSYNTTKFSRNSDVIKYFETQNNNESTTTTTK